MDLEKQSTGSITGYLPEATTLDDAAQEHGEKKECGLQDGGEPGPHPDVPHGDDLERSKSTKSIAETLSLPREIAFVSVICMAQFMTRPSPPTSQLNNKQTDRDNTQKSD
jgi:hypothetical protein